MTRIIEIEKCSNCPHRIFKNGELMQREYCDLKNIGFTEEDFPTMNQTGFPEWCPLKSLMGTKKTINILKTALEYCSSTAHPSIVQDVARKALKDTEIS